ncbi:MAG: DUF1570 domain-containing protein [Planctomycetota bacterium]
MPRFPRLFPRLLALVLTLAVLPGMAAATASATPQDIRRPPRAEAPHEYFQRAGREQRSKHYRILSDLPSDETELYAGHLDLIYEEYARRLAGLEQQAPEIPFVLMFARERDYLEVLRNRYGVNATGSGGMFFITPAGAALAFFTESLPRSRVLHVVQHEGFHQYAHSRFAGRLPPWVNEGLAEFFGEAIVVDGRVIVGQASAGAAASVRAAVEGGTTVPFLRILTMDGDQWNANVRSGNAAIQYVQSWAMVQYLGWADGGRYQRPFEAYLRLLHGGVPSERAFVQAFGTNDIESFERAWKDWAKDMQPTAFAGAAARLTFLAEGLRTLSRDGIAVESLEDALAKLKERGFSVEVTIHGRTERIEPSPAILTIPRDALAKADPVLEMVPPRKSGQTTAQRKREADHPTPPSVITRGLEPRELALEWTRMKSGDDFEYRLLSPKEAPKARREPRAGGKREKDAKPAEDDKDAKPAG